MAEVALDIDEWGVALVTLNRPEENNSWTPDLEREYYIVLDRLDRDPAVKVAVLTGAGRMFCPGAGGGRLEEIAETGIDYAGRPPFTGTLEFRKPLIAAINGGCAGVGLVQAMMCDVRFMASSAKLTTAFARRGLPAEHALSWLLPRIVGVEHALDLLLSARTVTADEALQIGLVSRVVPLDNLLPSALAYARDLAANCGPAAMATIKRQVWHDVESPLADAYERAIRLTEDASRSAEFKEGVAAFSDKRPPSFPGLGTAAAPPANH
ncbi:MAG TPA: enoyl-CoA hydratase-related protein [Mycobacteriales bacterium]|nr:enoyl-CoA hydratase-related protein [Mycobacteriales bacterium]